MFDDVIVVYKFIGDLMFYVTGTQDENELILYTVLQAFYESVSLLLRSAPDILSLTTKFAAPQAQAARLSSRRPWLNSCLVTGELWKRKLYWRTWIWSSWQWMRR
jgi:Clathrin adaptor complex small chain